MNYTFYIRFICLINNSDLWVLLQNIFYTIVFELDNRYSLFNQKKIFKNHIYLTKVGIDF